MKNTFIAVAVVALLVVGGVWMYISKPSEEGAIRIGFIGALTGDASSLGTVARTAVELAVEEINARGGIDGSAIEVIYEDGQCAAQPAINAANKLINVDKVTAVLGGLCSGETASFAPMAMEAKVPVISYCSSAPSLSQTGSYFSRVYPSDAYEGKFAAEYLYNTGARKVAVIYHIGDWGTGIKDVFTKRFTELGGEIVVEEGTAQTTRDYRAALTKVKAARPDYIYSPTYNEGGTALLKQAKELGVPAKFLGANAWNDPKMMQDIAGVTDVLVISAKTGTTDVFQTLLLSKTGGSEVPMCAAPAYDAMNVLAAALEKAGTNPERLNDAIRATKFDGVSGRIEFDGNGDLTSASYIVKRIANGTAVEIE